MNFERLCQSELNWSLLCPGSMVDAPRSAKPLRLSTDTVPAFPPRRRWMIRGPLKISCVLVPMVARSGTTTLAYADVAQVLVDHLEPYGPFSRRRVGIANPSGTSLKKSHAARAAERKIRRRNNQSQPPRK